MKLSSAERIKISKEEKRQKLAKIKRIKKDWYKRQKEKTEKKEKKKNKKTVSREAIWKREQRRRIKEKGEKIRDQTKTRVQNFRERQKENKNEIGEYTIGKFSNRTNKHRALSKLVEKLPKSPKKRTAVVTAYLQRNSPTVKTLVKLNKLPSPELTETIEISEAIIKDVKSVIDIVKHKRSDDARAAMNIICASVSGSSTEKVKNKTNLADKLGVPVRRMSGGKAVRQRVLTSEKSAFTHTKRKTRSDKLTDEEKETAYNFWTEPQNSRPTGNKKDIKRQRIGPKLYSSHTIFILKKTQTEVFQDFKKKYPHIKICQRTFERCKPFYVIPVRPKDRQTCCCRYHIEARSLFKSCMTFRKKIIRQNNTENETLPVFEHLNDLISSTMCEITNGIINKKCLNRECENCGIEKFQLFPEESSMNENDGLVNWSSYEYVKMNVKSRNLNKLCLVKKTTAPGEMFDYFKNILLTFPSHQFRACWQSDQMKQLIGNLPLQHCVCLHDFSENFSCFEKYELQTSYFQKNEVSLHVSVIYRHAVLEYDGIDSTAEDPNIVTEHFFVISPDSVHDNHFVFQVQKMISEYLQSISYETEIMHEFTDRCQSQYKSRHCIGYISDSCSELKYKQILRNYFESSHGKGPHDAAGGLVKQQASMAILRGTEIIQSARDLYDFGIKKLQNVKNGGVCKRRIFRYIESIPRDELSRYKSVPQNRSIHQIITTDTQSELILRDLSYYNCLNCSEGLFLNCTNVQVKSRKHVMQKERSNVDTDDCESTETVFDNLIGKNSILALFTDDPNEDYYILKALSPPEFLKREQMTVGVQYMNEEPRLLRVTILIKTAMKI